VRSCLSIFKAAIFRSRGEAPHLGFCPAAEKHKYSFDGARIPVHAYSESNAKMIGNSPAVAGIKQQALAQRGLAEETCVHAGNQAREPSHASLRSNPIKNLGKHGSRDGLPSVVNGMEDFVADELNATLAREIVKYSHFLVANSGAGRVVRREHVYGHQSRAADASEETIARRRICSWAGFPRRSQNPHTYASLRGLSPK
jgi:hypothetical protein